MRNTSLFVASWVLLSVLAAVVGVYSAMSTTAALGGAPDALTPIYSVEQLATESPEAAAAVRGRRLTAATWALAYAVLFGYVVLVPYRRGERWAWWALLISLGWPQLVSVARVFALGVTRGAGTSGIVLAFLLLGLLAGAPRVFAKREA